jgi:hypothetical protein
MLQTLLCDIDDDEVLDVISDLCRMVQRSEDDYQRHSLFNFLQHLMTAYRQFISLQYIPGDSVLGERLEKLQHHGFYEICKELKRCASLEPFDRIILLSFLKKHFPPPKKLPRSTNVQRMDAVWQRRRKNRR